jgi:nucleoside 2-deoxyribosyltransferase
MPNGANGYLMANLRRASAHKLRCFVAMAFGRSDTDALFDVIDKTLWGKQIRAIRIDQLNHNDDIDDRIISEINDADFAIADLTYARPSVYFEAGFAQRSVPVIYTVRSDHFEPNINDPDGNLRVHFDLQMKNIIAWKTASDKTFQRRLSARVTKVTLPLFARQKARDESNDQIAGFAVKSLQEKRDSLQQSMHNYFVRLRYRITDLGDAVNEQEFRNLAMLQRFGGLGAVCMKRQGDIFRFALFHIVPSITKALSHLYRVILIRQQPYTYEIATSNGRQRAPRFLQEEIVICSFGTGGAARLAREVPNLRPLSRNGTLEFRTKADVELPRKGDVLLPGRTVQIERQVSVHVIESTSQLATIEKQLKLRCVQPDFADKRKQHGAQLTK